MKSHISQDESSSKSSDSPLAHFFIYENLNYVADSKISKEQISIGRSRNADVVLDHNSVEDIHAFIHFEGQQAFLTNRYPEDGLHLNGQSVHLAKLSHEDVIDIGPYALKVKIDKEDDAADAGTAQGRYCVALVNRYKSDDDMQVAAETLAKQFRADPVKMALIIAKPEYVIKKDLRETEAERWQIALQKAGIFCDMRKMVPVQPEPVQETIDSLQPDHAKSSLSGSQAGPDLQVEPDKSAGATSDADHQNEAVKPPDIANAATTQNAEDKSIAIEAVTSRHVEVFRSPEEASEPVIKETADKAQKDAVSALDQSKIEKASDAATRIARQTEAHKSLADSLVDARLSEAAKAPVQATETTVQAEAERSETRKPSIDTPSIAKEIKKEKPPVEVSSLTPQPSADTKLVETDCADIQSEADMPLVEAVETLSPAPQQSQPVEKSDAEDIIWLEDDEDDEEDLWEAPFSLKDKLADTKKSLPTAMQMHPQMQIVKTVGDNVVDVQFIDKGKKYNITTETGKLCLASNKGKNEAYVFIDQHLGGYINNSKGEATADLNSYKRSDYLINRRKQLYRVPLPETGEVIVNEGQSQYRIVCSRPTQSPTVHIAERPSEFSWKHWAFSASTHLFFVICLSVYWYFNAIAPKPTAPHFVKIDPAILQQLQPKVPEPPKKQPPPPKPEPQVVAEKVEPIKKSPKKKPPKKVAKPTKSKRKIKKIAKAKTPNRHPKAGGGYGKGNVKNRNIKQTGILSVLGKTPLTPSTAIASVTNLDAVAVPGATDKDFTVGGVKGKLGNGKISVASGEMLQTKSSEQVFRSAGAKGPGHVAALEKGNTGKKKVQSMVTAKLSRTVKIRGGMSREMVKQVIDQHLEEVSYCYETALMSNPSIMGRIVFEWKILMSGRVGQVRIVASSVNSHEVHSCIKSAIQSWQFPKPSGTEVVVSYPFVFDLVAF